MLSLTPTYPQNARVARLKGATMALKKLISRSFSVLLVTIFLLMNALPHRSVFAAASYTVNSTLDEIDDDLADGVCHSAGNHCTLRAAIMQANKMTSPEVTINLPSGTYTLTRPPVGMNGDDNGDLNITSTANGSPIISIIGAGADTTTIDGNHLDQVFEITSRSAATIAGVRIQSGSAVSAGGGAIFNNGSLQLSDSMVIGNSANHEGGGISNHSGATMTVTNSTISGNQGYFGGGINNYGNLVLIKSTISDNSANADGGGISNLKNLTITETTISGNTASLSGGGIINHQILTIMNSTLSGNSANVDGGGIYNLGIVTIYSTSVAFNKADANIDLNGVGGGVYNRIGSTFDLLNSLVAGNYVRGLSRDCAGSLNSFGRNLFKNVIDCTIVTSSGSWTYLNSIFTIGPLQDNGGPTFTHALLLGSNAIDGGGQFCESNTSTFLVYDQRGFNRVAGARCDIGAYEYQVYDGADTAGVFRPSNGLLYLKNSNASGFADIALNYGMGGDYPVVGDWDGDGDDTIGVYRNGSFFLRNSNTIGFADVVFVFGQPGDQPVAGDWNGDDVDTIGIYRPSTGQFLLRDSNEAGPVQMSFYLGNVSDVGIAGDWDGDGIDTTGVFRPSNGVIFLKNTNNTGFADVALNYGLPGDQPVMGDWDDDGIDTIGIYRNGTFYLRNSNTIGFADIVFDLGIPGDMPIAGNWDGIP